MIKFLTTWLSRWIYCRSYGHVFDYSQAKPVKSIDNKFLALSVWCLSCKREFYLIDIEARGIDN